MEVRCQSTLYDKRKHVKERYKKQLQYLYDLVGKENHIEAAKLQEQITWTQIIRDNILENYTVDSDIESILMHVQLEMEKYAVDWLDMKQKFWHHADLLRYLNDTIDNMDERCVNHLGKYVDVWLNGMRTLSSIHVDEMNIKMSMNSIYGRSY